MRIFKAVQHHFPFVVLAAAAFGAFADWDSTQFVIGAWHDPDFTGEQKADAAALQSFKDAGFNTLMGEPGSFVASSVSGKNAWYGWQSAFGYNDANAMPLYPNVSARYRLRLLAQIGGLKTFLFDEFINSEYAMEKPEWRRGIEPNVVSMIRNGTFCGVNSCGPNPAFSSKERQCLCGFLLPDEANILDNCGAKGISTRVTDFIIPVQNTIGSKLPSFACVANFGVSGDASKIDGNFNEYIAAPSTKIVCFDYYLFEDSRQGTNVNGYFKLGGKNVSYFARLNNLAKKIQGKNIALWSFGGSVEHYVYRSDGRTVDRHHVDCNAAQLRYASYAPLLYGAKGILFYGYNPKPKFLDDNGNTIEEHAHVPAPQSPLYESQTYFRLKEINQKIRPMGPVLMSLHWVETLHGASIDPCSREPNLDTLQDTTTPFYFNGSASDAIKKGLDASDAWRPDSIAIGIFKKDGYAYLLVLNKSLFMTQDRLWDTTDVNNTRFIVKGNWYPRIFDKNSGTWNMLSRMYDVAVNRTAFELRINAGDMQMVWLGPAKISP